MFANAEGVSQRAPVNWSENVIGAAVCFPYVVALDESFITIHSMLDQQLKQTLSFRDGQILQDFEGILIAFLWIFNLCHLIKSPIHYLFRLQRASEYHNRCRRTRNIVSFLFDTFYFLIKTWRPSILPPTVQICKLDPLASSRDEILATEVSLLSNFTTPVLFFHFQTY